MEERTAVSEERKITGKKSKREIEIRYPAAIDVNRLIANFEKEEAIISSQKNIFQTTFNFPFDKNHEEANAALQKWYKERNNPRNLPFTYYLLPTFEGYQFTIRFAIEHSQEPDLVIELAGTQELPTMAVMLGWLAKLFPKGDGLNKQTLRLEISTAGSTILPSQLMTLFHEMLKRNTGYVGIVHPFYHSDAHQSFTLFAENLAKRRRAEEKKKKKARDEELEKQKQYWTTQYTVEPKWMELDPAEFDLNESNQVSTHRYVQEWRGNKVIVQRTTGVDTPVLQMYSALSNRHLVSLEGACTKDPRSCLIVTEYVDESLHDMIRRKNPSGLTLKKAISISTGILNGLIWLHDKKIAVRALTAYTVYLVDGKAKIGDLHNARTLPSSPAQAMVSGVSGSPAYLAPELMPWDGIPQVYTCAVDIYSFAMVMTYMLTGDIESYGSEAVHSGKRPQFTSDLGSEELKQLIESCWAGKPEKRPTALEALKRLQKIPTGEPVWKTEKQIGSREKESTIPPSGYTQLSHEVVPKATNPEPLSEELKEAMRKEARGYEWKIPFAQLNLQPGNLLGEGASGTVTGGSWSGRPVALKQLTGNSATKEAATVLLMLGKLSPHPNVLDLFGVSEEPGSSQYVVMELLQTQTLAQMLPLKDPELQSKILICIVDGMIHLHAADIIHRDLAPRNVLISEDLSTAKICDFGLSREVSPTSGDYTVLNPDIALPLRYLAPETLLQNSYSKESDVWMFACLCWELFTQSKPHEELKDTEEFRKLARENRLQLPFKDITDLRAEWAQLLQQCQQSNIKERPCFVDIKSQLQHL